MKERVTLLDCLRLIASLAIVLLDFSVFEARKAKREGRSA